MHYLSACNRDLFKSCYCYVLFLPNLSNIKNIFNSISIYYWKKVSLLTHMRNKCIMREINLYFLTLWKMAKFFLQKFVVLNMITVSKEMGNIRKCKEIHLQKLIKFRLSGKYSLWQVVYKWRIIWEEFLLPISCKMFWKKISIFALKTLNFRTLHFAISSCHGV